MKPSKVEKLLWIIPVIGYIAYQISGTIDLVTGREKHTNQALGYALIKYHSIMFIGLMAMYLIWATWDK